MIAFCLQCTFSQLARQFWDWARRRTEAVGQTYHKSFQKIALKTIKRENRLGRNHRFRVISRLLNDMKEYGVDKCQTAGYPQATSR